MDAHLEHTWNLLYVSANSAADAAVSQLGVAKSQLFGKDAEDAADAWCRRVRRVGNPVRGGLFVLGKVLVMLVIGCHLFLSWAAGFEYLL